MRVYILFENFRWEGSSVKGVYVSRAAAEHARDFAESEIEQADKDECWGDESGPYVTYTVEEYDVLHN